MSNVAGGTPTPDHNTKKGPGWVVEGLVAAVLAALVASGVAKWEDQDVALKVSVVDPGSLTTLPRTGEALTAVVQNLGSDPAKDVRVSAGPAGCGIIETLVTESSVVCQLHGQVSDELADVRVTATAAGDQADEVTVPVKWREALCPLYDSVFATADSAPIAVGTLVQVAARWNAAVDSMNAAGCDKGMDRYKMDPTADRAEFGDDASLYIAEFDRTRPSVVNELKVKLVGDAAADEADVLRLLAAVATNTPAEADRIASAKLLDQSDPSATTTTVTDGLRVPCGDPVAGIQIAVKAIGDTKEWTISTCR